MKQNFFLKTLPYNLLFLFVLALLFGRGLNFDGTLYAAIARNLANNQSIWNIKISWDNTGYFYEHPPLGFWLQLIFFKIFGDHRYTEKLYIAVFAFLSLYFVGKVWTILTKKPNLAWAPQLFLILCETCYSVLKNNWLEMPAFVFSCLSISLIVKMYERMIDPQVIKNQGNDSFKDIVAIFYAILSGCAILCAVLTKPPIPFGLFGVSFLLYFLYSEKIKFCRCVFYNIFTVVPILVFVFYVFYFNQEARHFLNVYLNHQLLNSVLGQREIVSPHFSIFVIFIEFVIPLAVFLLLFLYSKSRIKLSFNKKTIVFLLCALLLSLPCAISAKNYARYLLLAYLFYAFFFCSLCMIMLEKFENTIANKSLNNFLTYFYIAILISGILLAVSKYGKVLKPRQKGYFALVDGKNIPHNLDTLYMLNRDPVSQNLEVRYNFLRDYSNINIRIIDAPNVDGYYLYTPSAIDMPISCVPIAAQQGVYQIVRCQNL